VVLDENKWLKTRNSDKNLKTFPVRNRGMFRKNWTPSKKKKTLPYGLGLFDGWPDT
jgi:hypothetical protein